MKTTDFYQTLESFDDFNLITEDHHFSKVPDDWFVFITDVKGSTKAIESGRYKDVNTIGAASISCAQNAMGGEDFPFVFGGDGATLLVPADKVDVVKKEMVALKKLSQSQFALQLRVGMVPVKELHDEGAQIHVAKFELVKGRSIAIFRGGGLSVAEDKIKASENYEVKIENEKDANLEGLSCRWQPIPNKRGKILSLLVASRQGDKTAIYREVLEHLDKVFAGNLEQANPVNSEKMKYKSIGQCYRDEKRYHAKANSSFLKRLFEITTAVMVFGFKVPFIVSNPQKYANSMRSHSDYRKFDDMLRMIIDCSEEQEKEIVDFLDKKYQSGEIYYGTHASENSLMTCFVQGLNDGEHIHFIDGGNGGYAMAAKGLKEQMKLQETQAA